LSWNLICQKQKTSLKYWTKITNKNIKVEVIKAPVKDLFEIKEIIQNIVVSLIFVEKSGNRFKTRIKLDEIVLSYLSEIKLLLPVLAKKRLHLKLMNILSFYVPNLYIYIIIWIIDILICLLDSVIGYDFERNRKVGKWNGNVVNGILGMKRDANLQLVVFFHSYDDIIAVLISWWINTINLLILLILLIIVFICRCSVLISAVLNGVNTFF
jgi:hypothetical protein